MITYQSISSLKYKQDLTIHLTVIPRLNNIPHSNTFQLIANKTVFLC